MGISKRMLHLEIPKKDQFEDFEQENPLRNFKWRISFGNFEKDIPFRDFEEKKPMGDFEKNTPFRDSEKGSI